MAPGTEKGAPQQLHHDSDIRTATGVRNTCIQLSLHKLADITCREKAGSIFHIFWALSVQMEMPAINKHPLIETIVYTRSIFCKVTEP